MNCGSNKHTPHFPISANNIGKLIIAALKCTRKNQNVSRSIFIENNEKEHVLYLHTKYIF